MWKTENGLLDIAELAFKVWIAGKIKDPQTTDRELKKLFAKIEEVAYADTAAVNEKNYF